MGDRNDLVPPWMQTTLDVPRGVSTIPYNDRENYERSSERSRRRRFIWAGVAIGVLALAGAGAAIGVVVRNQKMAAEADMVNQQALIAQAASATQGMSMTMQGTATMMMSATMAGTMGTMTMIPSPTPAAGGAGAAPAPAPSGGGTGTMMPGMAQGTNWWQDPRGFDETFPYNAM
ncbi:hypothetical protein M427DRAFT_53723 [Gonapodya prolifera JEL478]|uniref:Uncharacterized protein n=1 Tax=Gonapodya prolifera (strain JEL478) TaxID=1344416 RepID=A0A139ANV6_GONPJ|nr:hypothetical protein M427DRAFT_53723 [Gonapodya prolifera JEL478]|eukprot:KXS18324.1 hypothetical protein M427DRAFT_53723 [Gonapodya prolifera JEL478]